MTGWSQLARVGALLLSGEGIESAAIDRDVACFSRVVCAGVRTNADGAAVSHAPEREVGAAVRIVDLYREKGQ